MAQIPGTNVSAPIVPNDTNDVFPSAYSQHIAGGMHTGENTVADRDAITPDRRQWGMEVKLFDGVTFTKYELVRGQASQDITDNNNWVLLSTSDVDKAYVDAADASISLHLNMAATNAARANDRLDTLVANAPHALDTLKEIADQLAADEQGTAAILVTQQQHTQQLANLPAVPTTTDALPEGNNNLYYQDARVLLARLPVSSDSASGPVSASNYTFGAVSVRSAFAALSNLVRKFDVVTGQAKLTYLKVYGTPTNRAITSNDTVITAFETLEKRINDLAAAGGSGSYLPARVDPNDPGGQYLVQNIVDFSQGGELIVGHPSNDYDAVNALWVGDNFLGIDVSTRAVTVPLRLSDGNNAMLELGVNTVNQLTVNGQAIGSTPDLSQYARKDRENQFMASQSVRQVDEDSGNLYGSTVVNYAGLNISSYTAQDGVGRQGNFTLYEDSFVMQLVNNGNGNSSRIYFTNGNGIVSDIKNGGLTLTSPNGSTTKITVTDTGKLALNGVELSAGGGGTSLTNTDQLPEGSTNKYYTYARVQSAVTDQLAGKVDKVNGLQLSQESYTTAEKSKLAFNPYAVPTDVRIALTSNTAKWKDAELVTATGQLYAQPYPSGSAPGMKFMRSNGTTSYVYEYMVSSYDTGSLTLYNWVRYVAG